MERAITHQKGYAVFAMLLVVFVSGSSIMLGVMNNRQALHEFDKEAEIHTQLKIVKEALLAFTANTPRLYNNEIGPGYLPCPDTNNNGAPDLLDETDFNSTCPKTDYLGRLPEYALVYGGAKYPINSYYSGVDEQFWYIVSPYHLRTSVNTSAYQKTSSNLDRLSLDNDKDIVAIIIAPGRALNNQDRSNNKTDYTHYIELINTEDPDNFSAILSEISDTFNDQIITITHDELMNNLGMTVANRIYSGLNDYYADEGNYPTCFISGALCPWVDETYKNIISGNWIFSELWNSSPFSPVNYNGTNYYYISQIFYNRNPSTSPPEISFSGCPDIVFKFEYQLGITQTGTSCNEN